MPHPLLYYVLLTACLLLGGALALSAWRRPLRRWRVARVAAGLLAAIGLWLTAYPPHRQVPAAPTAAVLLTPGYRPDSLRALLRRLVPAARVWRYAPTLPPSASPDTPVVADLRTLREQAPDLRRLHVLGRGLPPAALPQLGPVQLVWPAPATVGFQAARWNRQFELGQALVLEGYFAAAPATRPVWVRLHAAGAARDSVQLPARGGAFRLRYTPKAAGRLLANVSAGPRRALLASEPVPAEVLPPRPLRVLLLAATPSFELKFLKNQLAARQHAVAWRADLSRGLTQTEFRNQPAASLDRLTPALLARYDVLVAESSALAALSAPEHQALHNEQRRAGLGLVVLADAATLPRAVPGRGAVRVVPNSGAAATRLLPLAWPDAPTAQAAVPATLALGSAARALVTQGAGGRAVATAHRYGAGTTVVSALLETFPWLLQDAVPTYESYWSCLLSAAARPVADSVHWRLTTAWPRPTQPTTVCVEARFPAALPTVSDANGAPLARLALRQDPHLPEWSTATFWPSATGWQQLTLPGAAPHWFYVFSETDWPGPETQQRRQSALPWLASAHGLTPTYRFVPWPVGWFFGLFLLAAGFLWLEEKL